jgi:hypothetical protein
MKKIFLVIALTANVVSSYAQCASNSTHTDATPGLVPANGGATPANNTFQQNTFDWTQPNWVSANHTWGALSNGVIGSPYFSASLTPPFASGSTSNFLPAQGWELIKQDFGYFYSGNEWNGSIMGNSPIQNGDPRQSASKLNYFILYNKYSGLLRVMCFINNNNTTSNVNTIYVKMAFVTNTEYANIPSYQPSVNALFNHYNPRTAFALDQKTGVTIISAPATYPSGSDMIYADFQLAYDPCTCLFQSGLEVSFYSIQTANITLSGTYAGTGGIPIANITNNTGTVWGAQTGDAFIASLFEQGGSPQSAILSYNDASKIVSSDEAQQAYYTNMAYKYSLASDAFDATSSIPIYGCIGTTLKDAMDQASKVESYHASQLAPSDAVKASAAITVETGYLQATGTVTDDPNLYNGIGFKVGIPGAKAPNSSATLPEYAPPLSGDVLPNYPMYNEVMGSFALLKTPEIDEYIYPAGASMKTEYHPSSDLVYALNPIYDASKSSIYIAYEIDAEMSEHDSRCGCEVCALTSSVNMNYLYNITIAGVPYRRYQTNDFPISCNQSVYTQENLATFVPDRVNGNYMAHQATLDVFLSLVSLPDAYGKIHVTAELIKYNCKVNSVSTDFETSNPGLAAIQALSVPDNLIIPQTVYSIPTNTFSFGTITINGSQTDNAPSNGQVTIVAEEEIDMTANASLSGNINLYTQALPSYFTSCSNTGLSPVTGTNLTSYCNGSGYNGNQYMANQAARAMASSNTKGSPSLVNEKISTVQTKLGTNLTLGIFPNPTSGIVYLNLSAQSAGGLMVNISDLNGNQVLHTNFSANEGANSFKLDIGSFNSGVYFINITDENGTAIKNDKLVLMGQ